MSIIEGDSGNWAALMTDVGTHEELGNMALAGVYMKLDPRHEPYRVRLMAVPKVTRRHWEVFKAERHYPVSPAIKSTLKESDIAWSLGGWVPSPRFTTVVIDRESGKPRIMEFNRSVFRGFTDFMQISKVDPSGLSAPDFLIRVDGHANNKFGRDYTVAAGNGPRPFTDQEMAQAQPVLKMAATRTRTAKPEEIRDAWMALPFERKYSPVALEEAKARNGYGTSSKDQVLDYIREHGRNIYVPVLDHGTVVPAPMADMDETWRAAYSSYYVDFGIKPNRYLEEKEMVDELASLMMAEDEDLDTRWIDPNSI